MSQININNLFSQNYINNKYRITKFILALVRHNIKIKLSGHKTSKTTYFNI